MLFHASPVIFPSTLLQLWAQEVAFLNPFTQITQDIRSLVLYDDLPTNNVTAPEVLGEFGRLLPIGVAFAMLCLGIALFKRNEP